MKVIIRLFGEIKRQAKRWDSEIMTIEGAEFATVRRVFEAVGVPEEGIKIILVNGIMGGLEDVITDGDTLSVFPPAEGG